MGFNSGFKGLINSFPTPTVAITIIHL